MQTLTAAVVLAWIVIVVLAFAMAGLLRQLRDVQAALHRTTSPGVAKVSRARPEPEVPVELPAEVRPRDGRPYALVLLVDEHCPICAEVTPGFAALAESTSQVDFVVLARSPLEHAIPHVRTTIDAATYRLLDPGWRPALVVVDTAGTVLDVEPAGSGDAVRDVLQDLGKKGVPA